MTVGDGSSIFEALLELPLVFIAIEMTVRFDDQVVWAKAPFFITSDTNSMAGAAGSSVGADKSPVISRVVVVVDGEVVHQDLHVGEGGHEVLRGCGDGGTAVGDGAVDGEGASGGEVGGDGGGILAAPGCGVVSGEGLEGD